MHLLGGISIALCAVALAGCDQIGHGATLRSANVAVSKTTGSTMPIPQPVRARLVPQPEPKCEFATTDPNSDERQMLDYERQCYRHAEMIVRDRLHHLQSSVASQ